MRVMIAGGGTGGHLYPGIALAEELRRRSSQTHLVFVGTARGIESRAVPKAGFELELLAVSGIRGQGLAGTLLGLARLPGALWSAWRLVGRLRPNVAVSVGGYAAGPAVLAAYLHGVPCVVLEQNAVAGVTNRILARLASRVVGALPCADFPQDKLLVLGNPVRASFQAVRDAPYEPSALPRLLVLGGSQGARALNDVMIAAAPLLQRITCDWQITHQTGQADAPRVNSAYEQAGLPQARAMAFIDDMASAYGQHDLVLCRAGATTLAELTMCGRPSILVPFPFASGDHQTANGKILQEAGAALLMAQPELQAPQLVDLLQSLSAAPARLQHMARAAHALGRPQAVVDIANVLEAVRV